MTVEAHHYQPLRRSNGGGGAASRPPEVPDAAQGNSESQHRRNRSQPSPTCCARHLHAETEPRRQQLEPQGQKRPAHNQRGCSGQPATPVLRCWRPPRLCSRHSPSCGYPVMEALYGFTRNGTQGYLQSDGEPAGDFGSEQSVHRRPAACASSRSRSGRERSARPRDCWAARPEKPINLPRASALIGGAAASINALIEPI